MILKYLPLEEIRYQKRDYPIELKQSIINRGIVIAVKVKVTEDGYECVDGHKRCTILKELSTSNDKFKRVPCTLINDFSKSGSAYWGNTQNRH